MHILIPNQLLTPRMTLRPVTPADRDDLVRLEADPEVMLYLNGGLMTPEQGLSDVDYLTPRGTEPEVMAAHQRTTGEFLGWFALFDEGHIEGERTAELGYRLQRCAWGQGYATEGAHALVSHAFSVGVTCVLAKTAVLNVASRRVLEKAGFHLAGQVTSNLSERPIDGAQDEVVYVIRSLEP